jgi:hypothetical protein
LFGQLSLLVALNFFDTFFDLLDRIEAIVNAKLKNELSALAR